MLNFRFPYVDCDLALACDDVRRLDRLLQQRLSGEDFGDEAVAIGVLCGDGLARQVHLHGAGLADQAGQALGAAGAGNGAKVDLRLAEPN